MARHLQPRRWMSTSPRTLDESCYSRLKQADRIPFLLRYAELAPSSHHTQPWIFRVRGEVVDILPDLARWLQVSDADQRELRESIGCALENLVIAADHFGFQADVSTSPAGARVELAPGGGHGLDPDLFRAIPHRRTCRTPFDGRPLSEDELQALWTCADFVDVRLDLTDDPALLRRARRLTVLGDMELFADPAWRAETARWFGQGALTTAWPVEAVGKVMMSRFNLAKSTARGDARLLRTSPLLGMLSVRERRPEAEILAGRALERLWLKATSLGLAFQPVSQMLQAAESRARAAGLFAPLPWLPVQPFRVGRVLTN